MEIIYEVTGSIHAEELADVFRESGIIRPVEQIERLQRMIEHADILVTARHNGALVGVARALTDYSYCCYLSDLAVHKEYQRLGIGKRLIEEVQHVIGEEATLLLLSSEPAMHYYPRVGFEKCENAFRILRKR